MSAHELVVRFEEVFSEEGVFEMSRETLDEKLIVGGGKECLLYVRFGKCSHIYCFLVNILIRTTPNPPSASMVGSYSR